MCLLILLTLFLSLIAAGPAKAGLGAIAVAALCLAALAPVVAQWLRHPDAFWDLVQGGVVGILQDDSRALRWLDWEIAVSRYGEVDLKTRRLRVERRAFFGLIPAGVVDRSLDDFYRVAVVRSQESTALRLELQATDVRHVLLFDVGHGGESEQMRALMSYLRTRLSDLVEPARIASAHRETGGAGSLAARIARATTSQEAPPVRERPCGLRHGHLRWRLPHLNQLAERLGGRVLRSSRSRGHLRVPQGGRLLSVSAWIDASRSPEEDLTRYTLTVDSPAALHVQRPAERLEVAPQRRTPYEVAYSRGAERLTHSGELWPILERLFDTLGISDLMIDRGTIYADKPAHPHDLCYPELSQVQECITRLAELLEAEQSGLVTSLVARDQTRCPFCRDDIDPATDELVACESCGTQHHAECFSDLGRCTIRGCEALRASPVQRRLRG